MSRAATRLLFLISLLAAFSYAIAFAASGRWCIMEYDKSGKRVSSDCGWEWSACQKHADRLTLQSENGHEYRCELRKK